MYAFLICKLLLLRCAGVYVSCCAKMLALMSYIEALMHFCLGLLVLPHVVRDSVVVLLPLTHKLLLQVGTLQVLLKFIPTLSRHQTMLCGLCLMKKK